MTATRRQFISRTGATVLAAGLVPSLLNAQEKKYRACIIGDTQNGGYGHSMELAFAFCDNVEVVGLADPDEEGRQKMGQRAHAANLYADYHEMLEMEKPDLVSIGPRWPIHHLEYIQACAAVGAHGYMEKPIAVDLAEADQIVRAVDNKNLKWAIAHQKRFTPHVRNLKKQLDAGLIGDLVEVRGRGKEDQRSGGEDLIVLGTHLADLLIFFLGKPKTCSSKIMVEGRPAVKTDIKEGTEPIGPIVGDTIHASYTFESGVPATFTSQKNPSDGGGKWGLEIRGSKGVITLRINTAPVIQWCRDPQVMADQEDATWEQIPDTPEALPDHPTKLVVTMNDFVVKDVLAAIEEDRQPVMNLGTGRDAHEMLMAVYESHIQGKEVTFPLSERSHPLTRWG